jgi:hypothetical protein
VDAVPPTARSRLSARILAGLSPNALHQDTGRLRSGIALPENIKADRFEVRGPNAEALAFLLPELRHAEVFRIRVEKRKAVRLLLHQVVKASRFAFITLRLAAGGVLCKS